MEIKNSLKHILAKSNPQETLTDHTEAVLSTWAKLKTQYKDLLEVDDQFWELSFASCLFHDSGKIVRNFQDVMNGKIHLGDNYLRHEFISGMLLYYVFKDYIIREPHAAFAVFSHHKAFNDELFSNRERLATLHLDLVDFDNLLKYLESKLNMVSLKKSFVNDRIQSLKTTKELSDLYDEFHTFFIKKFPAKLRYKDRRKYIYYKAILNTADWCASGHEDIRDVKKYTSKNLADQTIQKLRDEGKTAIAENFSWMDFQKKCLEQEADVLAIAPTGSGKTEAALLWASKKKENEKIIYLLPTRVTSNAIYKRLSGYFDDANEHTAVIHSSAFYYRKDKRDDFHKGLYLISKTFFKNINVCTIDQVLTQGFNIGYWELKTFHALNARIIIDEIHLYAPYTLGLIIATIKYLKKEFGVRFFIMTATMPSKLQTLLKDTLGIDESKVVRDLELLNKKRNFFEVRDSFIDDISDEIVLELENNKKVLIVVNTVNEAIRVYTKFKQFAQEAICYHSRFIQKDRIQKEKEILEKERKSNSLLLVATQVVEVCLDIDFDILFSENAPIDAIIQRAGRVNRKRAKQNTKVIVFKEQEITRKYVYTDVEGVLDNTFNLLKEKNGQKLSESDLIKLVDEVYKDYEVTNERSYKDGLKVYKEVQRNNHYIKDVTISDKIFTREGLDTINVIPQKFYDDLSGKEVMEKTQHELSVRISYFKKFRSDKKDSTHTWFNYIDAQYNYEYGLILSNKKTAKPITSIIL